MADIKLDFDSMVQAYIDSMLENTAFGESELKAFLRTEAGKIAFEEFCDNWIKEQAIEQIPADEL